MYFKVISFLLNKVKNMAYSLTGLGVLVRCRIAIKRGGLSLRKDTIDDTATVFYSFSVLAGPSGSTALLLLPLLLSSGQLSGLFVKQHGDELLVVHVAIAIDVRLVD